MLLNDFFIFLIDIVYPVYLVNNTALIIRSIIDKILQQGRLGG